MNLFRLADDPERAARAHDDTRVVKMCLEAGQLCCTALHRVGYDGPIPYAPTHTDHPLVEWVANRRGNFAWAHRLCEALRDAKVRRYGGGHATWDAALSGVPRRPACLPPGETPQYLAMPERFHRADPVAAYRAYWRGAKDLTYDRADPPDWL